MANEPARRRRRTWFLVSGVLLAMPAAAGTAVADPAQVVVSGRLVLADGGPAADRPVVLTREVTLGDVGRDALKYLSTIGVAGFTCITGDPALEVCRRQEHLQTTDGQGRFRFVLSADDVRASDGELREVTVWAGLRPRPGERRGATVSWNVLPDKPNVELPVVPVWTPGLRAETHGTVATYTWRPPPAIDGATEASTSFSLRTPTQSIGVRRPSSPQRIDLRVLEDSRPDATLTHSADVHGVHVVSTSPTVRAEAGAARRPISRKRPCRVRVGDQPERTYSRCWLVDGDFSAPLADTHPRRKGPRLGGRALPVSCGGRSGSFGRVRCVRAPVAAVTIDLGRPRAVGEVVIRSSRNQTWTHVRVEVSSDRKTWRSLGRFEEFTMDDAAADGLTLDHDWHRIPAPPGTRARYVRVRADDDPAPQDEFERLPDDADDDPRARVKVFRGDLATMTEIAVWPARPKPSPSPSDQEEEPRQDEDGSRLPIGAVTVLVLGLGLVLLLINRRRP